MIIYVNCSDKQFSGDLQLPESFQFEKVVCTLLVMGVNSKSQGNFITQWIYSSFEVP